MVSWMPFTIVNFFVLDRSLGKNNAVLILFIPTGLIIGKNKEIAPCSRKRKKCRPAESEVFFSEDRSPSRKQRQQARDRL